MTIIVRVLRSRGTKLADEMYYCPPVLAFPYDEESMWYSKSLVPAMLESLRTPWKIPLLADGMTDAVFDAVPETSANSDTARHNDGMCDV